MPTKRPPELNKATSFSFNLSPICIFTVTYLGAFLGIIIIADLYPNRQSDRASQMAHSSREMND